MQATVLISMILLAADGHPTLVEMEATVLISIILLAANGHPTTTGYASYSSDQYDSTCS
jgi:hypothetical protein